MIAGDRVVLLLKRLPPEVRLPKGTLEAGEAAATAALREVAEETGFADLRIVADLGCREVEVRCAEGWQRWPQHYFLMRLTPTGASRAALGMPDGSRSAWFGFDDARTNQFPGRTAVLRAGLEPIAPSRRADPSRQRRRPGQELEHHQRYSGAEHRP